MPSTCRRSLLSKPARRLAAGAILGGALAGGAALGAWPWTNADLESAGRDDRRPAGWHYLRQAHRVLCPDDGPPGGATGPDGHCLHFFNEVPGREAQAQRTIAFDRPVEAVVVSAWVKLRDVRPGQTGDQRPQVFIVFDDEKHDRLTTETLGPWLGTANWTRYERRIAVPSGARTATVYLGLVGATGEAWFDGVEMNEESNE